MNSPAHDVVLFLAAANVATFGGLAGWVINANGEPPSPDTAITVYDTGGLDADTDEMDVYQPNFMVRTRAKDQTEAYQKQVDIRRLLVPPGDVNPELEMTTSWFTAIVMTTDVLSLGRDGNGNWVFTANFRSRRTEKEN